MEKIYAIGGNYQATFISVKMAKGVRFTYIISGPSAIVGIRVGKVASATPNAASGYIHCHSACAMGGVAPYRWKRSDHRCFSRIASHGNDH